MIPYLQIANTLFHAFMLKLVTGHTFFFFLPAETTKRKWEWGWRWRWRWEKERDNWKVKKDRETPFSHCSSSQIIAAFFKGSHYFSSNICSVCTLTHLLFLKKAVSIINKWNTPFQPRKLPTWGKKFIFLLRKCGAKLRTPLCTYLKIPVFWCSQEYMEH